MINQRNNATALSNNSFFRNPSLNDRYYPLPEEYLFLPNLADLDLLDLLHYRADWHSGSTDIQPNKICGTPGLISNRKAFRDTLQKYAHAETLSYEHFTDSTKKSWPKGGKSVTRKFDFNRKYNITLTSWPYRQKPVILKPRGYHANYWIYELPSIEHRWLINLLLTLPHNSDSPTLQFSEKKIHTKLETLKTEHPHLSKLNKKLKPIIEDLAELGLLSPVHTSHYTFNLSAFEEDVLPWPRSDSNAACQVIAGHLKEKLMRDISPKEESVYLIHFFHRYQGVRLLEMADLYRYLQSKKHLNSGDIKQKLKETASNRDKSTHYKHFFKDYQHFKKNPTSKRLSLPLDTHTIVGDTFRFHDPLRGRPGSLNLHYSPVWASQYSKQAAKLTLVLWFGGEELRLIKKVSSLHKGEPLKFDLTNQKLPPGFNLTQPLSLFVHSEIPLPGLTVKTWLSAGQIKK